MEDINFENKIIKHLTVGITHELNTPLTYTLSNIELLMEDINALDKSNINRKHLLEDAKIIKDGLHRIANVVELLHELSSDSYEEKQDIDIYSTLIDSLTLIYNRSKNIAPIFINNTLFSLNFKNKNRKTTLHLQKNRVITLWSIIITNALNALKTNNNIETRRLDIEVKEIKDKLIVSFRDNGGGIKEDILNKIFNRVIDDRDDGGMGIGLKVAKKIVDENSAMIDLSNVEGGALFQVTFTI